MNKNELELLLSQGEGYNLEFKENYSKNIGREICAFANASGGKIIIGISDKGQKTGFKISIFHSNVKKTCMGRRFYP